MESKGEILLDTSPPDIDCSLQTPKATRCYTMFVVLSMGCAAGVRTPWYERRSPSTVGAELSVRQPATLTGLPLVTEPWKASGEGNNTCIQVHPNACEPVRVGVASSLNLYESQLMDNGLVSRLPGPAIMLRAPPVRAQQDLGVSVTASRHCFENEFVNVSLRVISEQQSGKS
ncbi:hypothetical protein CB1_001073073 [Camelus ferus]|nr:hypothetical protein CB1_001073073 [Camelus ferus]